MTRSYVGKAWIYSVLISATLVLSGAYGAESETGSLVRASRSDGKIVLENHHATLTFDEKKGTFTVDTKHTYIFASGSFTFIPHGELTATEGKARVVDREGPFGKGKAVEFRYVNGSSDMVALYPDSPFIFFQSRLRNATDEPMIVDEITPVKVRLNILKSLEEMRVLGCDGLTAGDVKRVSFSFLAAADPATRAGAVAGWITHDRGSGVVLSEPEKGAIRFDGRTEYGRLRIEPGKTAEGETLVIGYFGDALDGLEAYADAAAKANDVRLKPIPSGYCGITVVGSEVGLSSTEP